jgi:hypothetical protein
MQTRRKTLPRRFTGSTKKKSYGIGGAVMTLGKNLLQGKKFGKGMFGGVLKAGVTPGSGIGAGLGLAGALASKSKNPFLQKVGKGLGVAGGVAGMFTGGGGGGVLQNLAGKFGKGGGGGGVLKNLAGNLGGGGQGGGVLQGLAGKFAGGGGGGVLQNLVGGGGQGGGVLQNLAGKFLAKDGMKVYASGGSIPHMKVLKSFHEGGEIPPHPHGANGEHPNGDTTIRPATETEIAVGAAVEGGGGQTWRDRGGDTETTQNTGSTIETDPDKIAQGNPADADAGTIFSFNTEPISADMSQEQFEKAMQSRFVAKQFEGQDIQNPQQLADAYKGFTHQATLAIRENEPEVAAAAREFAKTNDNFKIKMEALGENATDAQIAKMMVDMNTDGLLGDLHGEVVSQFMPKSQLNAYKISDGHFGGTAQMPAGRTGKQINQWDVHGQTVTKGGQIYTSINDMGINKREGLEKFFEEASAAGVDLTKGNLNTEEFMREWFENPENHQYTFYAKNTQEGALGSGDQNKSNPGQLIYMKQGEGIQDVNQLTIGKEKWGTAQRSALADLQRLQQDWEWRKGLKGDAEEYAAKLEAMESEYANNFVNKGAQSQWIAKNYPSAIKAFNNPSWGYKDPSGKPIKFDEEGNRINYNYASFASGGKVKVLKAGGRIGALSGLFR